jgi:predicted GIY-YIG superfamily endonuclease
MIGIYKITNPEGKAYIGYSKKVENRWASHKNAQHKANYKLKESLTKHGGDSHQFEVIEEVDISLLSRGQGDALLRKRERYWIKELDTFNNGLNSNGGGSGCNSHTAESKRLIGEANSKPKPADFGANRKKWQHTEEFKEKLRNAKRKNTRPILMYDREGNLVGEFPNNQKAADYIGCQKSAIWNVLNGYKSANAKTKTTHVKGFTFLYV